MKSKKDFQKDSRSLLHLAWFLTQVKTDVQKNWASSNIIPLYMGRTCSGKPFFSGVPTKPKCRCN